MFWVYESPEDSWQYTGNVPVLNRFLWPIPSEMVDNLKQFKLGCGYNVWMQIIRTSVLGEWDMAGVGKPVKLLAVFLMLIGALLAFVALCCFVKVFVAGGMGQMIRCIRKNGNSLKNVVSEKNTVSEDSKVYGKNVVSEMNTTEKIAPKSALSAEQYILFIFGYVVNMFCYLTFAYNYPQECSMNFRYIEITILFPAIALGIVLQESRSKWFGRVLLSILTVFSVCSVIMIAFWGLA